MINLSNYTSTDTESFGGGARGPIPADSMVGVVVSVKESQFGEAVEPYIVTAKTGLRRLNLAFEVACGTYKGVKWQEGITLPAEEQNISLTAGQQKSADIGGRQLCAILDAARGLHGGDKSPEANAKRNLRTWAEFANLKCFIKVGIQDGRDGKKYNCLKSVVGLSHPDYATLKEKLEIIAEAKPEPVAQPVDAFGGAGDEFIPF